jgi:hypothetical protein
MLDFLQIKSQYPENLQRKDADLLSQKIFTARNRSKPKGRDFYDITFLSGRVRPEMGLLRQKLGIETAAELRSVISARIAAYDFKKLASDVAPFLVNQAEIKRVEKFREFWEQLELE